MDSLVPLRLESLFSRLLCTETFSGGMPTPPLPFVGLHFNEDFTPLVVDITAGPKIKVTQKANLQKAKVAEPCSFFTLKGCAEAADAKAVGCKTKLKCSW
jgi:hypothetical protein